MRRGELSYRMGVFTGLMTLGFGVFTCLVGAGVATGFELFVPRWIVFLAGVILVLFAPIPIAYVVRRARGHDDWVPHQPGQPFPFWRWLWAAVVTTLFAVMTTGSVLTAPDRAYRGGISGTAAEGRLIFGLGAVVLAVLAIGMWGWGIRQISLERRRRKQTKRA